MQSLQRLHGRFFSQLGCCGGFSLISQLSAHERWDDDSINGGTSIARWFMSWKIPSRKGMMTAGYPHDFGNPQTIPTSTAGACSWPRRGGLADNGFGNNFGAGPWGDWIRWSWMWHSPMILPLLTSEDHHPKVAWEAPWTSFEILWAQKNMKQPWLQTQEFGASWYLNPPRGGVNLRRKPTQRVRGDVGFTLGDSNQNYLRSA